jgi:serine/threonine protein kinase
MAPASAHHPSREILLSFGLGKLDRSLEEKVERHIEKCEACAGMVAELPQDSFRGGRRKAGHQSDGTATSEMPRAVGSAHGTPGWSPPPGLARALPVELAEHPDYEIVRELGRGGMGVAYLAHNRLMGRDEVLKVIGPQLVERPEMLDRFVREIRAVSRLQHPAIVTAYSAFRCGQSIVFVMEHVDGLDLGRLVRDNGPLAIVNACYCVHQAALALQHAHEAGIVHRDIKPANLMITRDGGRPAIKLLDFGLAKAKVEDRSFDLRGAKRWSEGEPSDELTSHDRLVGTPDFIAPEQIRDAKAADIRADIYSLGCTLYFLLSGRPPFRAGTVPEILQAHFSMEVLPLNLVRPEVPTELAALVAKMMAKDPVDRFQTPAQVAAALTPFISRRSLTTRLPTFRKAAEAPSECRLPGDGVSRTPIFSPSSSPAVPDAEPDCQEQTESNRSKSELVARNLDENVPSTRTISRRSLQQVVAAAAVLAAVLFIAPRLVYRDRLLPLQPEKVASKSSVSALFPVNPLEARKPADGSKTRNPAESKPDEPAQGDGPVVKNTADTVADKPQRPIEAASGNPPAKLTSSTDRQPVWSGFWYVLFPLEEKVFSADRELMKRSQAYQDSGAYKQLHFHLQLMETMRNTLTKAEDERAKLSQEDVELRKEKASLQRRDADYQDASIDYLSSERERIRSRIRTIDQKRISIQLQITGLNSRIQELQPRKDSSDISDEITTLQREVSRLLQDREKAAAELMTLIEATRRQYADLADDPRVKSEIESRNDGLPKKPYQLGPSRQFVDIEKRFETFKKESKAQ